MNVSIIIPCRNNIKYFLQSYNSIRKYYPTVEIVALDDASTDGTWEELKTIEAKDSNIILYKNQSSDRVGHTILYDIGVQKSTKSIVTILHSDMVATKNYLENMLKHIQKGVIVSATRIEPPLHPPGPEKHVIDFGWEPKDLKEAELIDTVQILQQEQKDRTTQGIFAPWMIYKEDFVSIGGHDKLFAPMELEDSDIFNRMLLAGYKFVQSRDAFVYHMTCRGSRFKDGLEIERVIDLPDGTKWYKPKDSQEYIVLRQNKFREWWRKWGTDVLHNNLMMPIVGKRYNIGYVIKNVNHQILNFIEPWSTAVYIDKPEVFESYIKQEQPNTLYDLSSRVFMVDKDPDNDIVIELDALRFTNDQISFITKTSDILEQLEEPGEYEYDIFKIKVKNHLPKDLKPPFVTIKNIF
jgi:glycosyltransferase involved in cell wall biosynthesis